MNAVVSLGAYYAAVHARLGVTLGTRNAFIGEPIATHDSDGRAHPYAALYPSPGWQHGIHLAREIDQALLAFQVTAAGGDVDRALRAIDRVRAALTGWAPDVPGLCCGPLGEPDSYDPGPLTHDADETPSRWSSPLLFTGLIWLPEGGTP